MRAAAAAASADRAIRVTCCLFWTWALPTEVARELYAQIRYHPALEAAAHAAAQLTREGRRGAGGRSGGETAQPSRHAGGEAQAS